MNKKSTSSGILAASFSLLFIISMYISSAQASVKYFTINGKTLAAHSEGVLSGDAPDYDWWHGCSPTSAGMMMGYYDRNGYDGLRYDNLAPGGVAELNTFSGSPSYIANDMIASSGHITDFYAGGYGAIGDDNYQGHSFDSLAYFMGTSQDSVSNSNGSTTFWNYTNGSRMYASNIYGYGADYYEASGMFGMYEYFNYAGYGSGNPATDINFYNQYVDAKVAGGFYLCRLQGGNRCRPGGNDPCGRPLHVRVWV
jgi:hypothetical protein